MKIGLDARSLTDTWQYRGIAKYIKNVIRFLEEEGHEVILYSWPYSKADSTYSLIAFGSRNYAIWENFCLVNRAKSDDIDVLICPLNTSPIFYDRRCIVIVHDLIAFETKTHASYYKRLNLRLTAQNREIICVSKTTLKMLSAYKISPKTKNYAPNVIDVSDDKSHGIKKDSYFFTITGTSQTKNLDNLLLAYDVYSRSGDKKLYILGNEETINNALVRNKLNNIKEHIVIINTGLAQEEVNELYIRASAFVLVSTAEGFGIPLLEAMKYGCAIVRSNIPVFNEIMEDQGFQVDPYNYDDIAKGLKEVETQKVDFIKYRNLLAKYSYEAFRKEIKKVV